MSESRMLLPALALVLNSFVWGVSWWPFRQLGGIGLHPLWATALIYVLATLAIALWRPRAFGEVLRTPAMWVLLVAAGTTNAAFNWGVAIGDVVRVVLLFYLMPLWAVLFARWLLGEALTRTAALRVVLALGGAAIVLAPAQGGWPLPQSLSDWLGVFGGMTFALNNVMLRREGARRSAEGRALAMFLGGVAVPTLVAGLLAQQAVIAWPPAPAAGWLLGTLALSVAFLVSNMALQYGAARLPANVTAVVMLTEVLFASLSAAAFGGAQLTLPVLCGGALILAAAGLSAWQPSSVRRVGTVGG